MTTLFLVFMLLYRSTCHTIHVRHTMMIGRTVTQKNGNTHQILLDDNSPACKLPLSMGAAGYVRVTPCIDKQYYLAPWLLNVQSAEVDHIDKNKCNNQMSNLRIVTRKQNMWNRPKSKDNTSRMIGVTRKRKGFMARIVLKDGKRISLGTFKTAEAAGKAYDTACVANRHEYAVVNTY